MSDIEQKVRYPARIHWSYAFGSFFDDFIMTAFSMRVYSFYETELFLPNGLIVLAITLYGVWNMFNDPLAGYISDIPSRTKTMPNWRCALGLSCARRSLPSKSILKCHCTAGLE